MILYHCTTSKKLKIYEATGCILKPVRGWKYLNSAKQWSKKTGRFIILEIECDTAYPLPDHRPRGHAYWTNENIYKWEQVDYGTNKI